MNNKFICHAPYLNGILLFVGFFLFACGTSAPIRISTPLAVSTKANPKMTTVLDLGALPLPETGVLDVSMGDGFFTPGEWLLIQGRRLHGATSVSIGEIDVPIEGYTKDGGILVRVPTGLSIKGPHMLQTAVGAQTADVSFDMTRYAVASDTDGNELLFFRMNASQEKLMNEDPTVIEQKRPLYNVISTDGGMAYSVGVTEITGNEMPKAVVSIMAIHLGAPGEPTSVGQSTMEMIGRPMDLALAKDNTLAVLTTHELRLVSVASPRVSTLLSTISLPKVSEETLYTEAAFFSDESHIALLDTANTVWVYDLADRAAPKPLTHLTLFEGEISYATDIVGDPSNAHQLFVSSGPSLRALREKLGQKSTGLVKRAVGAVGRLFGRENKQADTPLETKDAEERHSPRLSILSVEDEAISVVSTLPLPDVFVPFRLLPQSNQTVLVSGVDGEGYTDFQKPKGTLQSMVKRAFARLKTMTHFGQVYEVDVASGKVDKRMEGMQIFMGLDMLPSGQILYSGFHLSGHAAPPHVGVSFGIGIEKVGFFNQRKLGWKLILPPYSYGHVHVQH